MAERTLISWNVPNWLTVFLMAAAGYAMLAAVTGLVAKWAPGTGSGGGTQPDASPMPSTVPADPVIIPDA